MRNKITKITKQQRKYIMSKVKQWAEDMAEQKVDSIISNLKDGQIDLDTAKVNILNTENKTMLGINSENVDEVIQETLNA
jgi:gas vesicle protein